MKKYTEYDLRGDKYSYHWALEQAGAKVLAYESFGSYQGDWLARVDYKGKSGWIMSSYGSCSGCDSWEAESTGTERTLKEWKDFCSKFAKEYLEDISDYESVLKRASENSDWDMEGKNMVNWLVARKDL